MPINMLLAVIFWITKKYKAEMLVTYELQMQMITEWWKQLFGESEGKDSKGLLPLSCIFSTDLHSLGQFIQEGTKTSYLKQLLKLKTTIRSCFNQSRARHWWLKLSSRKNIARGQYNCNPRCYRRSYQSRTCS